MSVIVINAVPMVAGLYWLERGNPFTVGNTARKLGRPAFVHLAGQTGYAPSPGDTEGLPSLAAVLRAAIPGDFWMALVAGANGRLALIKVRDNAVLADGDELFEDRDAAVAAFERSRGLGWTLYATPGLVTGSVNNLDPADLRIQPDMRLKRIILARKPVRSTLGLAGLAAAASLGGWIFWENLAGSGSVPAPQTASAPESAPRIPVIIDSNALLETCGQVMEAHPPWLPAWKTQSVTCKARLDDRALRALHPELAGKPVLLVRWRLEAGHAAPVHRQIAETHIAGWYSGSVNGTDAWALMPLPPVLRRSDDPRPDRLILRRHVDRQLGLKGVRLDWLKSSRGRREAARLRITTAHALPRIRNLLAPIPGLEVTRLSFRGKGLWRIEARAISPVRIPEPEFKRLTEGPDHDA